MPLETWFPTVVFYEKAGIDETLKRNVLTAIADRSRQHDFGTHLGLTANNAGNDLHLDPRVSPLFDFFSPLLCHFFYDLMHIDREKISFHVGRCWPVVQASGSYGGGLHYHRGATFSAVYYLQTPPGSGKIEFRKPYNSSYDGVPKTQLNPNTYRSVFYEAVEDRLMVFGSDILHQRLVNNDETAESRIAIAFDIYSHVDLNVFDGGLPHEDFLRPIA